MQRLQPTLTWINTKIVNLKSWKKMGVYRIIGGHGGSRDKRADLWHVHVVLCRKAADGGRCTHECRLEIKNKTPKLVNQTEFWLGRIQSITQHGERIMSYFCQHCSTALSMHRCALSDKPADPTIRTLKTCDKETRSQSTLKRLRGESARQSEVSKEHVNCAHQKPAQHLAFVRNVSINLSRSHKAQKI